MNPDEKIEFEEMKQFIQNLKNSTTIPLEVDGAFRARLGEQVILNKSNKALNSEQHGSSSVGLKNPEVWGQLSIEGVRHFVALYK